MAQSGHFLTDKQRDYLTGDHEPPSGGAERTMRTRIRNRTSDAIEDLGIIARHLSAQDLEQLFQEPAPTGHHEAATGELSINEKIIEEYQLRSDVYREIVSIQALFYEAHRVNDWDYGDTLQVMLEWAHAPEWKEGNPRGLSGCEVNEDKFRFEPGLEAVESFEDRLERIDEKAAKGEVPLTDEEIVFHIRTARWRDKDHIYQFLKDQRKLQAEYHGMERAERWRPWMRSDGDES